MRNIFRGFEWSFFITPFLHEMRNKNISPTSSCSNQKSVVAAKKKKSPLMSAFKIDGENSIFPYTTYARQNGTKMTLALSLLFSFLPSLFFFLTARDCAIFYVGCRRPRGGPVRESWKNKTALSAFPPQKCASNENELALRGSGTIPKKKKERKLADGHETSA